MRTMLGDHQNHVRILTRLLRRLTPRKSSPRSPGCHTTPSPGCTGRAAAPFPLGAETSRAGRLEGVRVFSGTAGTCRVRVRNPGALRGRLGAGVVAYVPLIRALVTLSRAPRETALYPVHCSPSSLPGRYASAAYPPVCGGTTGNMPRIPGGVPVGGYRTVSICRAMSRRLPGRSRGCGSFFQSIGLHPGRVGA